MSIGQPVKPPSYLIHQNTNQKNADLFFLLFNFFNTSISIHQKEKSKKKKKKKRNKQCRHFPSPSPLSPNPSPPHSLPISLLSPKTPTPLLPPSTLQRTLSKRPMRILLLLWAVEASSLAASALLSGLSRSRARPKLRYWRPTMMWSCLRR